MLRVNYKAEALQQIHTGAVCDRTHAPAFVCHPPVGKRRGSEVYPGALRSCKLQDDGAIHPHHAHGLG